MPIKNKYVFGRDISFLGLTKALITLSQTIHVNSVISFFVYNLLQEICHHLPCLAAQKWSWERDKGFNP